jgi:glycosyltransferase involved in cell wall biosynthesis
MDNNLELSIIMPCLNEHETLEASIQEALRFFQDHPDIKGEILIADNGSTDGSIEIAKKYSNRSVRIAHIQQKGYGNALRGGTREARGKYCIMGDPDNSYDFYHLMPFIDRLRNGDDLVMGNRFRGGIQKGAMPWSHRYIGTPILSFIGRLFYKNNIGDFNCGLRGYNRQRILDLHLRTTGMEYASEMIVQASLHGYKISEVPTVLRVDGRSTEPHLSTWHDGWRHLRFLLMYSPKWLFLYPGIVFMIVGLFGMGITIIHPYQLTHVNFGINTLLFCGCIFVVGIETVLFSLYSMLYAKNYGYIPINDKLANTLQKLTMDHGVAFGSIITILGLCLAVYDFAQWKMTGFGSLNPVNSMRLSIVAVICLLTGIQLIFGSFFAGILNIRIDNSDYED